MTVKNLLTMAAYRIMANEEYIAEIRKRDKEDPDLSEHQLSTKLSNLVISYITKESELIKEILKELPREETIKALKDIVIEYAKTGKVSKDVEKKSRNKTHSVRN